MNQQLSWRTIVGYSLGDVANNFAFAMGALFLLSYYTDVAGVGAAAAGTMLLLVRVFDAFADVFAGRVVDSVNTRWGKFGNDSNLLIVFYVQIMPDDFVMQLHRF
ncbi:glucuronide carrier protein [Escherichia coli]|nr:glucuronide carrier protein [Escherichia coli]